MRGAVLVTSDLLKKSITLAKPKIFGALKLAGFFGLMVPLHASFVSTSMVSCDLMSRAISMRCHLTAAD